MAIPSLLIARTEHAEDDAQIKPNNPTIVCANTPPFGGRLLVVVLLIELLVLFLSGLLDGLDHLLGGRLNRGQTSSGGTDLLPRRP
jgi:hypothetical protein